MKFKVGDKVKVRQDLENGCYGIDNLEDYQNDKVFTISKICNVDNYQLLEDEENYAFREDMLIPAEEEIILKAVKNKQGFYEIKVPKEIKVYSYGRNRGGYEYIYCIKKEILDDIEKEYLRAVIKPFRDRVGYIVKNLVGDIEYITICVTGEFVNFPFFKKGTIYKGMEINKKYSFEELGL